MILFSNSIEDANSQANYPYRRLTACPLRQGKAMQFFGGSAPTAMDFVEHLAWVKNNNCIVDLDYEPADDPRIPGLLDVYRLTMARMGMQDTPLSCDGVCAGWWASPPGLWQRVTWGSVEIYWDPDGRAFGGGYGKFADWRSLYLPRSVAIAEAKPYTGNMPWMARLTGWTGTRWLTKPEAQQYVACVCDEMKPDGVNDYSFATNPNGTLQPYSPLVDFVAAELIARAA